MVMQVGIYVFDEVEVLDFVGLFEVFFIVVWLIQCDGGNVLFEVVLLVVMFDLVCVCVGMQVLLYYMLVEYLKFDVLIVFGGVVMGQLECLWLIDWIMVQSLQVKVLVFVCIGVFLLEKVGLLNECEVIMYWEDIDDLWCVLYDLGLLVQVLVNQCWVEVKLVVYYGGVCWLFILVGILVGIDLSLYLVVEFVMLELVWCIVWQMDYDWCVVSGMLVQLVSGVC